MFKDIWNYKRKGDFQEGERWLIRKEGSDKYHLRIIGKENYNHDTKEIKYNVLFKDLSKEEVIDLRDWLNKVLEED